MRTRKPKLASGERVTVDVSGIGVPGLSSPTGVVSTTSPGEPIHRRATRGLIGFTLAGALIIFLTYVVLATTVFVVMGAGDRHVAVLRNTFPVGQAPANAVVYASSAPADQTTLGKAQQAVFGVPAGSVVQIVAGPYAKVSTAKNGHIVADGKQTPYTGKVTAQHLARNYVAICLAGACRTHSAVIVGQGNIIGSVKGYVGLTGITPVASVQ